MAHPELGEPGHRCPQGMKESPRRARSGLPCPSQSLQAHHGARAGKAPSSHSSCSGSAASLTEPRPHSPHGSPLHVRHFKPCPPARATSESLHHRFFFPAAGFLPPLPPTCTVFCLYFSFFFIVGAIIWGFFTVSNTHCSKISPPPPSLSGSRRRRFKSRFPTAGRIINYRGGFPALPPRPPRRKKKRKKGSGVAPRGGAGGAEPPSLPGRRRPFCGVKPRARAVPPHFLVAAGRDGRSLRFAPASGRPSDPEVGAAPCGPRGFFPYALELSSSLDSPCGVRRVALRAAPAADPPSTPQVSSLRPPPPLGGSCPP